MINREDIDRLKYFAALGRGLWLGLFVPNYPNDPAGRAKHPLRDWLPEDAHLTLLHLDKGRSGGDVETIVHSAEKAYSAHLADRGPVVMEFTGVGWFWRRNDPTLVSLINSKAIFELRSTIQRSLAFKEVRMADNYGFIPHVTLRADAGQALRLAEQMSKAPALKFTAETLHIVCGDAKIPLT